MLQDSFLSLQDLLIHLKLVLSVHIHTWPPCIPRTVVTVTVVLNLQNSYVCQLAPRGEFRLWYVYKS